MMINYYYQQFAQKINYIIFIIITYLLTQTAVSVENITKQIELALGEQLAVISKLPYDELVIKVADLSYLPQSELKEIGISELEPKLRRFKVTLKYQDNEINNIQAHYEQFINIPVLNISLRRNELIKSTDITNLRLNLIRYKKHLITNVDLLIDKTPKNYITAYTPINEQDISELPVIKKNQQLVIFYQNNLVLIKTTAIALESGAIGEIIKVKNIRSDQVINAIIEDNSSARVVK